MFNKILRLFRRVRWSDGRVVKFRFDRVAWILMIPTHILHMLGIILVLGLFGSFPYWWLLVIFPAGLLLGAAANARLRFAVDQVERLGVTEASKHSSDSASFEWFARVSGWRAQAIEWCAYRCDRSEQKFLGKADSAAAMGNHRSAAKYRERAVREHRYADFIRRQAERQLS